MAKKYRIYKMTIKEYIEEYKKTHDDAIYRHKVYKMINNGELSATKDEKGRWLIDIKVAEEKPAKEYSVNEFVEIYNKKHPKAVITKKQVRELAASGKINAKKVNRKWVIMESPSRKLSR